MSICVKASASASACCMFATATTSALVLVFMHHDVGNSSRVPEICDGAALLADRKARQGVLWL